MTRAADAPARLARLAWKYETLAALRRARAEGEAVPAASAFKALADEFPGCLNELDTLPLDDLDARRDALAIAAACGTVEPWMIWCADYHAFYRAALRIKPRLAEARRRGAAIDDARAARLARDAADHAGVEVDEAFVRAVAEPPGGRIGAVVMARLEAAHGEPAAAIKRALFPRSRR